MLTGAPGPQDRLLGRAVARQHLSPGGPWRGGAGGGLRFGTRLRCRPPSRGPRCAPRCPPCARRCPPAAACRPPRHCWPPCCTRREYPCPGGGSPGCLLGFGVPLTPPCSLPTGECHEACAPPGADGSACTNGGTCVVSGTPPPGTGTPFVTPGAPQGHPRDPLVLLGIPTSTPGGRR